MRLLGLALTVGASLLGTQSRPTRAQVSEQALRAGQGPLINEAQVTADEALLHPPIGAVVEYGGDTEPAGGKYLFADGRLLEVLDYPELYAVYGTKWNTGLELGSQFRIPDRRGRVGVGAGQGAGLTNRLLASKFGAENHTLTTSQMPVHDHLSDTNFASGWARYTNTALSGGGTYDVVHTITFSQVDTLNAGSGLSHPNMQPSVGMNHLVRARS